MTNRPALSRIVSLVAAALCSATALAAPDLIVVNGDIGIAHYLYTSATEDKDGEIETTNGRYTDVLVRTDDGWMFLAWHGGGDDD